jgi:hypothetical protein
VKTGAAILVAAHLATCIEALVVNQVVLMLALPFP